MTLSSRLAGVPEPVTVRVPAKVNLALAVGATRDDGYHELTTVFQAVSLYDEVVAAAAEGIGLEVSGEGAAELPLDDGNLAVRAAQLLAAHTGVEMGVRLQLVKGIPVAGGMAGGSADAAATLVACDALWGTGLDRQELSDLAAQLGSDVTFALHGGTALGVGRGEVLSPVLGHGSYHWVFALADGGLSTPEVYGEFDRLGLPSTEGAEGVLAAIRQGDVVALGKSLFNDLQAAAVSLRPSITRVLEVGVELGAVGVLVSGSGPTVAMLARDGAEATRIAAAMAGYGVCRTVRRAHGPVPGARIVDGG